MTAIKLRPSLHDVFIKAFPQQMNDHRYGQFIIKVDDQTSQDVSDGFCSIMAYLSNPASSTFMLILENLPTSDEVEEIAEELSGTWQETRFGKSLTLNLTISQIPEIKRLAKAIRRVVGRGARYLDRNWKWKAPRAAASLEEFVRRLKAARRS